jgi:hypothetical protein
MSRRPRSEVAASNRVTIRLTNEELQTARTKATKEGIDLSAYVRRLLTKTEEPQSFDTLNPTLGQVVTWAATEREVADRQAEVALLALAMLGHVTSKLPRRSKAEAIEAVGLTRRIVRECEAIASLSDSDMERMFALGWHSKADAVRFARLKTAQREEVFALVERDRGPAQDQAKTQEVAAE